MWKTTTEKKMNMIPRVRRTMITLRVRRLHKVIAISREQLVKVSRSQRSEANKIRWHVLTIIRPAP